MVRYLRGILELFKGFLKLLSPVLCLFNENKAEGLGGGVMAKYGGGARRKKPATKVAAEKGLTPETMKIGMFEVVQ